MWYIIKKIDGYKKIICGYNFVSNPNSTTCYVKVV